jgi:hypothetical protein
MATYNDTPLEIIAAPFTAWLAAVGTAFPVVDAAPSGSWTKLGTSGAINYDESGVSIKHSQTIKKFRGLGATTPIKAFRTEEEHIISLTVYDLTLEAYKVALNANSITTVAASSGIAGHKSIPIERGLMVTQYALLVRGVSSYYDGVGQYEVPIVVQSGEPEVVFTKGDPAGLKLMFEALRHTSLGVGLLRMQTAAAS